VRVRHLVEGPAGLAVEEEQDIVYRGAEGAR
jgi:3-methylfumaryl-CoA hydratase